MTQYEERKKNRGNPNSYQGLSVINRRNEEKGKCQVVVM